MKNTRQDPLSIKEEFEDGAIEYEIVDSPENDFIEEIEVKQNGLMKTKSALDAEEYRLLPHGDTLDYAVAAGCGAIAGLLDVLFVGEFSLTSANEWGKEKCEKFVYKFAKFKGYKGGEAKESLADAINFLERKYKVSYDAATNNLGGSNFHHLHDLAHHPSKLGLVISIVCQFGKCAIGTDNMGQIRFVNCTNSNAILPGNNAFEKLFNAINIWACHLVSDMAGSYNSASKGNYGTGIPGPIMSLLQEASALNPFQRKMVGNQENFSNFLNNAFSGKYTNGVPLDLRTELGVLNFATKQAAVIALNEVVVRSFYFIRHLFREVREKHVKSFKGLRDIDWVNTLPFKNRTIERMMTISLTTFSAIDVGVAAAKAGSTCGGAWQAFLIKFVCNINLFGTIRFGIAIGNEVVMNSKLNKIRKEQLHIIDEYLALQNSKIYYKQSETWVASKNTLIAIQQLENQINENNQLVLETMSDTMNCATDVSEKFEQLRSNDRKFADELLDIVKG